MNKTLSRDDLVLKMNLGGVPDDVQDQIIAQYGENVLKAITLEVISVLSDEDRRSFEKVSESNDPDKIEKFLIEKVPDLDLMLKEISDDQIEKIRKGMSL